MQTAKERAIWARLRSGAGRVGRRGLREAGREYEAIKALPSQRRRFLDETEPHRRRIIEARATVAKERAALRELRGELRGVRVKHRSLAIEDIQNIRQRMVGHQSNIRAAVSDMAQARASIGEARRKIKSRVGRVVS